MQKSKAAARFKHFYIFTQFMSFRIKNPENVAKIATIGIVIYLVCFGIATAFFPIRPFWNDEWRLIYNIKFKTVPQLWGTLDLLQQCPRVYLTVLKKITSYFDYSYISLRLPALVITIANIFFCFYLKKKVFPQRSVYGFLFILILISSQTFTDYMVQVKQYEMEIFMCLLALWQLITLLEIADEGPGKKYKYALLCISFLAAPFFSYTYPIAVAPVILMVILYTAMTSKKRLPENKTNLFTLYLPLVLVCISIVIFYLVDVRQLMADNRMYMSYLRMLGNEKNENHFIQNFWKLFALIGSGAAFEIVFGILGIAAFIYGIYNVAKSKIKDYTRQDYLKLYALSLLILTLCLVLSGKLMGGVARLTAFTVPSICILIVLFLQDIKNKYHKVTLARTVAVIVFLGLFGNILSTCINTFTYPEYNNRINTYWNTSLALKQARENNIPILITDGVRGDKINDPAPAPGKISANTITADQVAGTDTLCAEVVLKVNPEYKTWARIPVYLMPDAKWTTEYMKQLPAEIKSAIVGDGITFLKLDR